jgi:endonuclease YncB( thermonuclease family)
MNTLILVRSIALCIILGPIQISSQDSSWSQEAPWAGKVIEVLDGDTIEVWNHQAEGPVRVRIYGIDSPEKAQPFGQEATEFAEQQYLSRIVTVYPMDLDRYGRTVARIRYQDHHSRDIDYGLSAIEAGAAWWYEEYAPDDEDYRRAFLSAIAQKRGLWALQNSIAPSEFRKR